MKQLTFRWLNELISTTPAVHILLSSSQREEYIVCHMHFGCIQGFYEFVLAGKYICSALCSYFNISKEEKFEKYPYNTVTILLLFLLF